MNKFSFFYLVIAIACVTTVNAQDFDNTISSAADSLAQKIVGSQRKTVAITDFINLDGSITQLGTFLSGEVSSELSNLTNNQSKFRVLERSQLDQILKEKNLIQSNDGSKMAKELGKLDAADILIFATITDFNGYYRISMKLLDTKTGDALSAYRISFVKSPSLENLNAKVIRQATQTQAQQATTSPIANPQTNVTPTKNEEPKKGDYCFKNQSAFAYPGPNVKIDIYNNNVGSNTPIKTINVTADQTSCAYDLTTGVYRLELTWYWSEGAPALRKENKEIRVSAGRSDTITLIFR